MRYDSIGLCKHLTLVCTYQLACIASLLFSRAVKIEGLTKNLLLQNFYHHFLFPLFLTCPYTVNYCDKLCFSARQGAPIKRTPEEKFRMSGIVVNFFAELTVLTKEDLCIAIRLQF